MIKLAVFIDRDGVINYDPGNFHKIDELRLFPRVGKAINLLNVNKIPSFVVTNQAVIARGWVSEKQVEDIHDKISAIVAKDRGEITRFYYCPHHPKGPVPKYMLQCSCRKPGIGMFEKAAKEYGINLKESYVIGDSFRDIESAKNIGGTSIAVTCGSSDFRDSRPDYTVSDLYEAVKLIIDLQIGKSYSRL